MLGMGSLDIYPYVQTEHDSKFVRTNMTRNCSRKGQVPGQRLFARDEREVGAIVGSDKIQPNV
jgi:hypothetical protein